MIDQFLNWFHLSPWAAFIIGFLCGFVLACFLTNKWARENHEHTKRLEALLDAMTKEYRSLRSKSLEQLKEQFGSDTE